MPVKGLLEQLDLDPAQVELLRQLRLEAAAQRLMFYSRIVATGGNIHGVNRSATARRRARNKVARAQRKANQARQ